MNDIRRGGFLSQMPPVTKNILIINIVVFLLCELFTRMGSVWPHYLALYNFRSEFFYPFQLVSHMFMHGGIGHIFFNMFGVYMFGRILESVLGSRRFFILYIVSGLGAALLQLVITHLQLLNMHDTFVAFNNSPSPDLFWEIIKKYDYALQDQGRVFAQRWLDNPDNIDYQHQAQLILQGLENSITNIPMVGASGAVFGILAAFAYMFPNVELMFIFVPFPIKAKYFVPIYAVAELFFGIANFNSDNIAHFAHLGGAIVGFLFVLAWKKRKINIS